MINTHDFFKKNQFCPLLISNKDTMEIGIYEVNGNYVLTTATQLFHYVYFLLKSENKKTIFHGDILNFLGQCNAICDDELPKVTNRITKYLKGA